MAAQQNAGRNADQQGQRHGRCHQLQMLAGVVQQITPILIDDICTYPLNQAGHEQYGNGSADNDLAK